MYSKYIREKNKIKDKQTKRKKGEEKSIEIHTYIVIARIKIPGLIP